MDWLVNNSPPWAAYQASMSGQLIALDKQPGVCPLGAGENRRWLFYKCVVKVVGTEATHTCNDDQI